MGRKAAGPGMARETIDALLASGIRSKRKRAPRGKPFPKGKPPPGAKVFQSGQSGNPDGRPPSTEEQKDFDAIAKAAAPKLLQIAIARLDGSDPMGLLGLSTPAVRLFEDLWALAGKPIPRKVEMSGPNNGPIELEEVGPARSMLLKLASEDLDDDPETAGVGGPAPPGEPPTGG